MSDVDGVIAALKVAADEAEKNYGSWWKAVHANRWVRELPGASFGRWSHLLLNDDEYGRVDPRVFVAHCRATIAYLEARREGIGKMYWWSPIPRQDNPQPVEPVDAEFTDISPPIEPAKRLTSKRRVRVIK